MTIENIDIELAPEHIMKVQYIEELEEFFYEGKATQWESIHHSIAQKQNQMYEEGLITPLDFYVYAVERTQFKNESWRELREQLLLAGEVRQESMDKIEREFNAKKRTAVHKVEAVFQKRLSELRDTFKTDESLEIEEPIINESLCGATYAMGKK
jgi:hypothetical protein